MKYSKSSSAQAPVQIPVRDYLDQLLQEYLNGPDPCLFLPSFFDLSRALNCSGLELYCLLIELRDQGFDFFTLGMDSPVTVWHPVKIPGTGS